ncbi:hypothetical protein GSI_05290 [Ganoderma sinense ZZ0214-1]|uniref:F-box domain-containing protein n=1 Tax=Ganoderma sinense ZZ0214-1 TaxID=1077348 RepID=A0A2G8SFW0_9APHY|nr:hypothetical protein GSI_05290 [Ganoderma sinense ZZ0214-1]
MSVQSKLTFMSLPLDILQEIEDHLDLLALLSLGGTCVYFRDRVAGTLAFERDVIIEHYWASAKVLLPMLTRCHAVISGEAALAFVMRNRSLLGRELEICVSAQHSDDLLSDFDAEPLVQCAWGPNAWPYMDRDQPTAYLYLSPSGDPIRIICSHTDSPFTPMSYYPTTALYNYMDEFSFGCAYRDLTLNHSAVSPFALTDEEEVRVLHIAARGGFRNSNWPAEVAVPPRPFVLFNVLGVWDNLLTVDLVNTVCLRSTYQCAGQPRFFGDRGSLVDFFEPDMVDHAIMVHWHHPPYGRTAIWRMPGLDCDYGCGSGDYLLRDVLSDVCMVGQPMHYGPFTSAVLRRVLVGESQRDRIWNSMPDNIRLETRNLPWCSPA